MKSPYLEWNQQLNEAKTWKEFDNIPVQEPSIQQDYDHYGNKDITYKMFIQATQKLQHTRTRYQKDSSDLKCLLQKVVRRNHLSAHSLLIQNAQHITETGTHYHSKRTRDSIYHYHAEVENCLEHFCSQTAASSSSPKRETLLDTQKLMLKLKHSMGRSALMLSGGGAQSLHHLGTIKALCESNLYDNIKVISGASGGSICAACCATMTKQELLKEICVPHVNTDYRLDGQMKKK